jgi:hypothetical protein
MRSMLVVVIAVILGQHLRLLQIGKHLPIQSLIPQPADESLLKEAFSHGTPGSILEGLDSRSRHSLLPMVSAVPSTMSGPRA